jgi:hypothetical protein
MAMSLSQKYLPLFALLLLWPMNVLGENINPDCIDDTFTQVNATGHLVVPGFTGPIGHNSISNQTLTPESNWTINTAITEIHPIGANTSVVAQTF